jgi:uncharacterized OsmC-like protein
MSPPAEFPDHIGVTEVTTRSHENMMVEAFMDGQPSIMADEPLGFDIGDPPALSGQSRGWTPVHYQLAALSMCTAITMRVVANDLDFQLGQLRTSMQSLIDIRGFFFDLHLQSKFEQVRFDLTLSRREPDARIKAPAHETDRRCPQLGLFRAAKVPMITRWYRRSEKEPVLTDRLAIRGKLPEERLRVQAARAAS